MVREFNNGISAIKIKNNSQIEQLNSMLEGFEELSVLLTQILKESGDNHQIKMISQVAIRIADQQSASCYDGIEAFEEVA